MQQPFVISMVCFVIFSVYTDPIYPMSPSQNN
jgi:hypothetical protein